MELFGYTLSLNKSDDGKEEEDESLNTFAPAKENDGAIELEDYNIDYTSNTKYIFDFESHFDNEEMRVNAYRRVAHYVEADYAITDIVNESVVQDQFSDAVDINVDDSEFSEPIKKKIIEEWGNVSDLFDINSDISTIFRQWYIDGKIYYHKIVDTKKPKDGIKEVRYLDPRRIKKVREIDKKTIGQGEQIVGTKEYYVYSLKPLKRDSAVVGTDYMTNDSGYHQQGTNVQMAMEIQPDMIAYAHSGIVLDNDIVLSYLQKALKPLNQLNLVEDAIVIFRLSRAPERRIFYVDVGNLNKSRAEQYMKSLINKYRNKFVYNTNTGTINTTKENLSMMEDIWLPRQAGSRGTEVQTLDGSQQSLADLDDLNYFKQKSYRALNVPVSRLDTESTFSLGRSSEITRDEVRFSKFAEKLRNQFSDIFYDTLKTQLILKRIITEEDWNKEKANIRLIYNKDSYFEELKSQEILQGRLEILQTMAEFDRKYYSVEWIRKRVLMQDDDEMEKIDKQIKEEKTKYKDTEEEEGKF